MNLASAPGKIILCGEHAVVYGRPALAVPVSQVCATVEVSPSEYRGIWIDAPDIRLKAPMVELPFDHPLVISIQTIFSGFGVDPFPDLNIRITSTIPVASGLGSGAAVSVALIRALSAYLGRSVSDEQVNQLAFKIEKVYHGTPSGIDNTVITYARPVYFTHGRPIETFKPRYAFTIVVGDTGISAPTRESVADLHKLWENNPRMWNEIFDQVGQIVEAARRAIEFGKIRQLGELMNQNQDLLLHMTVSSPELHRLIEAARSAGALGAKLSGGGRGGNMIALVDDAKAEAISEALLSAGAKRTIITSVQ